MSNKDSGNKLKFILTCSVDFSETREASLDFLGGVKYSALVASLIDGGSGARRFFSVLW